MTQNPTPSPAPVEQADRDMLAEMDDALGFLTDVERPILLQAFARHRIAYAAPSPVSVGGEREALELREAALMDCQYIAGVKAGWNAAQSDNAEAELAALHKSREGRIAALKQALAALNPTPASPGGELPEVCDGKEQDAFESWASGQGMAMDTHPLHWLFLDPKTNAARQGWKAATEYWRERLSAATPLGKGDPK